MAVGGLSLTYAFGKKNGFPGPTPQKELALKYNSASRLHKYSADAKWLVQIDPRLVIMKLSFFNEVIMRFLAWGSLHQRTSYLSYPLFVFPSCVYVCMWGGWAGVPESLIVRTHWSLGERGKSTALIHSWKVPKEPGTGYLSSLSRNFLTIKIRIITTI